MWPQRRKDIRDSRMGLRASVTFHLEEPGLRLYTLNVLINFRFDILVEQKLI